MNKVELLFEFLSTDLITESKYYRRGKPFANHGTLRYNEAKKNPLIPFFRDVELTQPNFLFYVINKVENLPFNVVIDNNGCTIKTRSQFVPTHWLEKKYVEDFQRPINNFGGVGYKNTKMDAVLLSLHKFVKWYKDVQHGNTKSK